MVSVGKFICTADKYHWSDTLEYYMHGIGFFYYAFLAKTLNIPTEADHELVWLTKDECLKKLFLDHQSWAVEQSYRQYIEEII